jgi:cellulose biosynthesis protein BcsQ
MRAITIFNNGTSSNFTLNICAQIARAGKKVLHINLKNQSSQESEVGLSISSFLSSNSQELSKYIIPLEKNLDIIKGSFSLHSEEFQNFEKLMTFHVFENFLKNKNYDYIFFEATPTLNMLALNSLFASTEVMCVVNREEYSFVYSLVSFLVQFNKLYTKKVLLTKILPVYLDALDRKEYSKLVFDFTSRVVSYPFFNKKNTSTFSEELSIIAKSILDDQQDFGDLAFRNKKIELEYLGMLDRISEQ